MQINPAVLSEAERFTDGPITDQVLRDVAAMKRLPLYIDRLPPTPPGAEEMAINSFHMAEAAAQNRRAEYVKARMRLAAANKRQPYLSPEDRRHANRSARADAMRALNIARVALLYAERRLGTARAAAEPTRLLMAA